MKKTVFIYKLVVEGRRTFPIDMLRYDACVPWDQQNANEIERTVSGGTGGEPSRVTLRRYALEARDSHHAAKRWESFGWRVVSYEAEAE